MENKEVLMPKEVLMFNDLIEKDHAVEEAEDALFKAQVDFWKMFKSKKNWKIFAKRHGCDRHFEFDRIIIEDGFGDDKIRMLFVVKFHGETEYYETNIFPKQELIDFLSAEDYYAPILAKEKEEEEKAEILHAEAEKERRKKMYEELKKEFENE